MGHGHKVAAVAPLFLKTRRVDATILHFSRAEGHCSWFFEDFVANAVFGLDERVPQLAAQQGLATAGLALLLEPVSGQIELVDIHLMPRLEQAWP